MKNGQLRQILKQDIEATRDETVDFVWNELARKNITIERKPNKVRIYSISLISFSEDSLSFKVSCSKGTYIRVLGKEIAEKLGTVGHIKKLVMTRVGSYNISSAETIENFYSSWKLLKT